MGYGYSKPLIVFLIIAVIILVGATVIVTSKLHVQRTSELELYSRYLRRLTPEEVINEYFINMNNKDIDKTNLVVRDDLRSTKTHGNLRSMKIINITFSDSLTEEYKKQYYGLKYLDIKAYSVDYEISYYKSGPQNSGIYELGFCLIREDEESGWRVSDFGFQ